MQELLDACVQLDRLAAELYELFAQTTTDDELKQVFERLHAEETDHLAWWAELQNRFDAGDVTEPDSGSHVTAYLRAIVATLRSMLDASPAQLSDDDRLALAASLEFFTLDPVFGWMIHQSDAARGAERGSAYAGHVDLLISAMEARDSWPLAPHIALLRSAIAPDARGTGVKREASTGLPGHAVAERALADLCHDGTRTREPISLALIDLALTSEQLDAAPGLMSRVGSALTSLLRFTDLLAAERPGRFAVVLASTSGPTACATAVVLAEAASGVAEEAGLERVSAISAVVTLPPGDERCTPVHAFEAAEQLLHSVSAAGELLGALEIA